VLRALLPSIAGDAATTAQVRLELARLVDPVEAESLYVAVAEDAASPPVERSRAWYEGGRLAQARGDTAAAKTRFAAALATEGGDERSRVAARDALAGIRYFE
jgi:hypothetical protein